MKRRHGTWAAANLLLEVTAVVVLAGSSLSGYAQPGEEQSAIRIVTFGTSLTAGGHWQQYLAAKAEACLAKKIDVVNLAKSGANSDWGLRNTDRVIAAKPDIVLIEFSINDAALHRGVNLPKSEENIRKMAQRIRAALPRTQIFLMTMSPVRGLRGLLRPHLGDYYESYRNLSAELSIGLIDHRPAWARLTEDQLRRAIPDGAHPDPAIAADLIAPSIMQAIAGGSCRNR